MNKKTMQFIRNIMQFDAIGNLLDNYSDLTRYHQNVILFAALINDNQGVAWKSWRHEDGRLCFGGGWFIVGIDTPQGSFTYHFEDKYWSIFDCKELEVARHHNDHSEKAVECGYWIPVIYKRGKLLRVTETYDVDFVKCSECGSIIDEAGNYCPNCGKRMYFDADGLDEMIMNITRASR